MGISYSVYVGPFLRIPSGLTPKEREAVYSAHEERLVECTPQGSMHSCWISNRRGSPGADINPKDGDEDYAAVDSDVIASQLRAWEEIHRVDIEVIQKLLGSRVELVWGYFVRVT